MTRCFLFDIDGTLADNTHRQHYVEGDQKDWPAFLAACDDDAPIQHMIYLATVMAGDIDILFITGRSDEVRDKTLDWLRSHFGDWIASADIYMRKAGDFRPDTVVKGELLDEITSVGFQPIMAFEDRDNMVAMFRQRGIPCCQVAESTY